MGGLGESEAARFEVPLADDEPDAERILFREEAASFTVVIWDIGAKC